MTDGGTVLLVDDKKEFAEKLADGLAEQLREDGAKVEVWTPTHEDQAPARELEQRVGGDTRLVITDYDLTEGGQTGLFGPMIVSWCQRHIIPVGNFSRGAPQELPDESDLFELRVPTGRDEIAPYVAGLYRGFAAIRRQLEVMKEDLARGASTSSVMATILERRYLEPALALYVSKLAPASSGLFDRLRKTAPSDVEPTEEERISVLTYIIGHVLSNSVLRYPGPILSNAALLAYVTASPADEDEILPLFDGARYTGPFAELGRFFWRVEVDDLIDAMAGQTDEDFGSDFDQYNRRAVENALQRQLTPHGCPREGCLGTRGGFWCPFTDRPVCNRSDCSVAGNSWVPEGAELCRVEREFFDEWAPLLGL